MIQTLFAPAQSVRLTVACDRVPASLKEGGTITSEMSVLGGVRFTVKGLG